MASSDAGALPDDGGAAVANTPAAAASAGDDDADIIIPWAMPMKSSVEAHRRSARLKASEDVRIQALLAEAMKARQEAEDHCSKAEALSKAFWSLDCFEDWRSQRKELELQWQQRL